MKEKGIYKIINILDNKFYIGRSSDLTDRKRRHFRDLKKNKHHNKHLQRAYNKYGNVFEFNIIEYTNNIVEREKFYFSLYQCKQNKDSYNIRDIDDIQGDDTRYKKGISQFDMDGKFIKYHDSIKQASIETNSNETGISRVLKGKRKKCGGYIWQYGNSKIYNFINKNIILFDKNGNFVKLYKSSIEASYDLNYINGHFNEKINSMSFINGYYLRTMDYTENRIKDEIYKYNIQKYQQGDIIIQKDLKGLPIRSFFRKELVNIFGKKSKHISEVLQGKRKSTLGYLWELSIN